MTNSIYPPYSSTSKPPDVTISKGRWLGFGFIKTISVACGLIALIAVIRFSTGTYGLFKFERELPNVQAGELGNLFGEFVGGLFFIATLFILLTLKLWSVADSIKTLKSIQVGKVNLSTFRKIANWILGPITSISGAFAVLELINATSGALAILFASDPSSDHSLFKFDFSHELLFWLPAGMTVLLLTLTLVLWKLKSWLASH